MSIDDIPEFYRTLDSKTIQSCREGAIKEAGERERIEPELNRQGITYDFFLERIFHNRLYQAFERKSSLVPVPSIIS